MAPDLQFAAMLNKDRSIGGVIIEVTYSNLKYAQEKAKRYLIEADKPRPSVVVVFNFEQNGSRADYHDVDLEFEVYRRNPADCEGIKVYEKGVSD